ncbi:MAG: FAD-binding oxidoreductase [Geminicoccaceae bacterium]|nr:FAD-binding oxidoreductase [Geminicoccaceae bacterium]
MKVLVLGAGVIGAATAFFLARRGAAVAIVERAAPACAASGKAGGFLALDWCDGLPRAPLSRRSFGLHGELARDAADALGHRPVETWLVTASGGGEPAAWLGPGFHLVERLGEPTTTALVDPARLTCWLVERAVGAGARLLTGTPEGLEPEGRGWRLRLAGTTLRAEAVVLALGPWTNLARIRVKLPPVFALLGHSLRFELAEPLPPRVLFARLDPVRHGLDELEIYPRADGSVVVAGLSRPARPPAEPTAVGPDPGAAERLLAAARAVLPALSHARRVEPRACLRPVSADGTPLLGPVPGRPGLWLATGHGPWGILEGPASGELLADLLLGATPKFDPRPFDPARPTARP